MDLVMQGGGVGEQQEETFSDKRKQQMQRPWGMNVVRLRELRKPVLEACVGQQMEPFGNSGMAGLRCVSRPT